MLLQCKSSKRAFAKAFTAAPAAASGGGWAAELHHQQLERARCYMRCPWHTRQRRGFVSFATRTETKPCSHAEAAAKTTATHTTAAQASEARAR